MAGRRKKPRRGQARMAGNDAQAAPGPWRRIIGHRSRSQAHRSRSEGTGGSSFGGHSGKIFAAGTTAFLVAVATVAGGATWNALKGRFDKSTETVDIKVVTLVERVDYIQGASWILDDESELTAEQKRLASGLPSNLQLFNSSMRTSGAADPNSTFVRLIVEGGRHKAVRLIDIKASIKSRAAPLRGTLFWAPPGGGGEVTQLGLNLDEPAPVARVVELDSMGMPERFTAPFFTAKQTKTLAYGEQEVFSIYAETTRHYVEWCLRLDLLVELKPTSIESCPDNRAIRTSALLYKGNTDSLQSFSQYARLYNFDEATASFVRMDPRTGHRY